MSEPIQDQQLFEYFYSGFDSLYGTKLKSPDLIKQLIQVSYLSKEMELLHAISFDAKYICGLMNILSNNNETDKSIDTTAAGNDLRKAIESITVKFNSLLSNCASVINVMKLTASVNESNIINNTEPLLQDLNLLKIYFNMLMAEAEKA